MHCTVLKPYKNKYDTFELMFGLSRAIEVFLLWQQINALEILYFLNEWLQFIRNLLPHKIVQGYLIVFYVYHYNETRHFFAIVRISLHLKWSMHTAALLCKQMKWISKSNQSTKFIDSKNRLTHRTFHHSSFLIIKKIF